MKKIAFYLFGIFAFLLFTNADVSACSCLAQGEEPLAQQVSRAKNDASVVFTGKVLEIVKKTGSSSVIVKFRAEKSWKGNVSRRISLSTGADSALCGFNFEVGKSYLIYAQGANAKDLQTNICTRTAALANAKADLKALGKGRIPKS
ncbi:MAG TPA: hypothetical protein VF692_03765 [Pyrinomonadaceae bacterium]|jgi:hypothetical protein